MEVYRNTDRGTYVRGRLVAAVMGSKIEFLSAVISYLPLQERPDTAVIDGELHFRPWDTNRLYEILHNSRYDLASQ